jgi:prophage antirepressor-like protein
MNAQENLTPMAFRFNATSEEMRSFLIEEQPWFVAKDLCDILGHTNHKVAVKALDEDEVRKVYLGVVTGIKRDGTEAKQNVATTLISESGLYALIMRSNKPEAKAFRKWVTSEVLPAIRKKGFYKNGSKQADFIDARDVPHSVELINNYRVTVIYLNEKMYLINDLNRAIQSTTSANQVVKKLNAKRTLATKIWLFGQTNPTWFTNDLGKQLLFSGSRIERNRQQLLLPLPMPKGGVQ